MYGGNRERTNREKRQDARYHAARRDLCILKTAGRSPGLWCVSFKIPDSPPSHETSIRSGRINLTNHRCGGSVGFIWPSSNETDQMHQLPDYPAPEKILEQAPDVENLKFRYILHLN